jgi:hypothetical protein
MTCLIGEAVLLRELEVALVVRGHAHHGAFAVAHQHVVADPDRHARAGERMLDGQPVGMPFFSIVARSASITEPRLHSSTKAASLPDCPRRVRRERMLGRDRDRTSRP